MKMRLLNSKQIHLHIIVLAIAAVLSGCTRAAPSPSASAVPLAMSVECSTFYRSSVRVSIERQEKVTLTANDSEKQVSYDALTFHAAYYSGDQSYESRSISTWVTTTGSEDELARTLYQFAKTGKPGNQFNGGEHGFTGMNYVYDPISRAELQFWCTAQ